ncbi:MAG: pilus assembly protein TadG-related protein [Janthinobacterium lividum]
MSRDERADGSGRIDILRRGLRSFVSNGRGNVAIIFGLASLPLLAFTGAAIDYGLATRLQVKLQAATDATALTLCQTPQTTTTPQLQSQAKTVMTGYMANATNLLVDTLAVTSAPRKITLTTHVNSRTFFPAFTGVSSPKVTATSQCATPLPKTFEIAMVLDNTGSMANSSGSQSKLQAAQEAAANFVDYVNTNDAFSSQSRIAIVPFAGAVAIDPAVSGTATASWVDTKGQSIYHWTNVAKSSLFASRLSIFNVLKNFSPSWGWAGCFESQPYPQNVQDGAPSTANTQAGWNSLYVPYFAPDEPGKGTTGLATWSSGARNAQTYVSYNSYIDDTGNCSSTATDFPTAESQACKYANVTNAKPTTSGPASLPNGPNFLCNSKPLQRLTSDTSTLKSLIASMVAAGSTNIHEGMIWGWRTLSPISVFGDGAAYSPSTSNAPTATSKVIILMTDGANSWPANAYTNYNGYTNYNQTLYFPDGYLTNADGSDPTPHMPPAYKNASNISTTTQQRNALDQLTLETCTNAKAAGISIYTIGFSVASDPIDNQGITLLQNCASNSKQAFVANDSTGLIGAFSQIAASIGALRISQ